jgi:hypothetical protein
MSLPDDAALRPRLESSLHICTTCGVARPGPAPDTAAEVPPAGCPICLDERQYVGGDGQRWTTLAALRAGHRNAIIELEPGLHSIRTTPGFAISQHAMLVETAEGNVLWDCVSLVDDATLAALRARGGVAAMAISHPHFYATMAVWSRALGGVPIHVHAGDAAWLPVPDPAVRHWDTTPPWLPGGVTLVHTGGHFAGSQSLLWPGGAGGRGVLLVGDEPNVCADHRWVTFMRSFPNYIPLAAHEAERVVATLRPHRFDRIYGWTPDRVVADDARLRLERSLERHIRALRGEHGVVAA